MLLDRRFDHTIRAVGPAAFDDAARRRIEEFILCEARCLDERRFDDWLALWTDDGRYWVPRHHDQDNPFDQISLFWEDALLRKTRVRRLLNERNWSQQPPTRAIRLIGSVHIDGLDAAGRVIVRSSLHCTESRLEQRQLSGEVFHKLEADGAGSWRMHLKRVNLVNCDSVLGNLEVFI
jgi:ethylbenzene dioxygenase beta subunit